MDNSLREQKNALLAATLANVAFDGFSPAALSMAEQQCGFTTGTAFCLFPNGIKDVLDYWHATLNENLTATYQAQNPPPQKIREKIHRAVMLRFGLLADVKPAVRAAMGYYTVPFRVTDTASYLYQIVDQAWRLAGDTATDYNFYTKRTLLAGVYVATLLYWLQDESEGHEATEAFLYRRIENVLKISKVTNIFKRKAS